MDLDSLRAEIDRIDSEMLALFLRRMEIVGGVARYKQENNLPVLHPAREAEILERRAAEAGPEMSGYTRDFFEGLMAVSRRMQQDTLDR